jgi:hypothetical protein
VGAGSLVMALGAGRWNAMSVLDCSGGMGSALFRGALGRHLRWAVTGCWFAVLVHGGCVMIAIGSRDHWQAVARAGHCRADP